MASRTVIPATDWRQEKFCRPLYVLKKTMNTFAENSIFVQSRLEKSDPGIACRRGPDLQKTLATLVLSEVPLKIVSPAGF